MEKQMRQQMNQKVSREIIEIRHTLHAHPELSGKENNTKLLLMNFIREHTGFQWRIWDTGFMQSMNRRCRII
jgi:metal-dependent amidase/aminoacylase/carboxypeptidase family protein